MNGSPFQESRPAVAGIPTYTLQAGKGEPVVLVHGAGVSTEYWRPAMRALCGAGRRAVALDLPGFGRTRAREAGVDLQRLADHLTAWHDEVIGTPCHLVGQSLGCEISVMAAASRPELFRTLCLAGPAGLPELESLPLQLLQAVLDAPREPLSLYRLIIPSYLRAGPLRLFRQLFSQLRADARSRLYELPHPVLVLRGESDPIAGRTRAARILACVRDGREVVIPGAHACHFSHPAEFAAALTRFWGEVEQPRSQPEAAPAGRV